MLENRHLLLVKHATKILIGLTILFGFTLNNTFGATNFTPSSAEAEENLNAATVLYQKNITKVAPANTAFYEGLNRKNAALLVKRFATNVLGKKDIKKESECAYTDI